MRCGDANTSLYFGQAVGRGLHFLWANFKAARINDVAIPTFKAQTPLIVYLAAVASGKAFFRLWLISCLFAHAQVSVHQRIACTTDMAFGRNVETRVRQSIAHAACQLMVRKLEGCHHACLGRGVGVV